MTYLLPAGKPVVRYTARDPQKRPLAMHHQQDQHQRRAMLLLLLYHHSFGVLAGTVVEVDHNNSVVVDSLVHSTVPAVDIVAGHIPAAADCTVGENFCPVIY